jgi:hypothetical protein
MVQRPRIHICSHCLGYLLYVTDSIKITFGLHFKPKLCKIFINYFIAIFAVIKNEFQIIRMAMTAPQGCHLAFLNDDEKMPVLENIRAKLETLYEILNLN